MYRNVQIGTEIYRNVHKYTEMYRNVQFFLAPGLAYISTINEILAFFLL